MQASVVDLRYKTKEILKSLERNEKITILYHGKIRGTILPPFQTAPQPVQSHPFFSSVKSDIQSVDAAMNHLRSPRYRDL